MENNNLEITRKLYNRFSTLSLADKININNEMATRHENVSQVIWDMDNFDFVMEENFGFDEYKYSHIASAITNGSFHTFDEYFYIEKTYGYFKSFSIREIEEKLNDLFFELCEYPEELENLMITDCNMKDVEVILKGV